MIFLNIIICAEPLNSGECLSNTFEILRYCLILKTAFKDTFDSSTLSESPVLSPPPQIKLD